MNLALFRWQMRKSLLIGIIFAAILTLYVTMITSMYDPQSMAALVKFRDSMPQVMAAVGMDNAPTTLPEFLVNFLYGFLFLVFPMAFTLIRAHGTMAKYIDSGALATLLASPVSRRSLALTQFAVVITGTTMLLGYVTALEAIAATRVDGSLPGATLLTLNGGLLVLHLAIAAFSFWCSVAASEAKTALALGAGIPSAMLIFHLLAQAGEKTAGARFASIFTLFDPQALIADGGGWGIAALAAIGVVCLVGAIVTMDRRDFSL